MVEQEETEKKRTKRERERGGREAMQGLVAVWIIDECDRP